LFPLSSNPVCHPMQLLPLKYPLKTCVMIIE
jgi:hypothetical protein